METLSEYKTIHEIVDNLPEPCKSVINQHYFQGVTFTAIADEIGFSKERIRQIHLKALKILRNNKTLQEIYGGYKRHYNWNAVQSLQNRPNTSSYVTDSTKKGYTDLVYPVIFLWEIFSCRCIKIDLRTQEIMLL